MARRCPLKKKMFEIFFFLITYFLALNNPRLPISVPKKIQPNRFSRLAKYDKKYIYDVLFYYINVFVYSLKKKFLDIFLGRVGHRCFSFFY